MNKKSHPKIDIQNIGDKDSNYYFCKASRGKIFGLGSSNDSLKAREKAIFCLNLLENKGKKEKD